MNSTPPSTVSRDQEDDDWAELVASTDFHTQQRSPLHAPLFHHGTHSTTSGPFPQASLPLSTTHCPQSTGGVARSEVTRPDQLTAWWAGRETNSKHWFTASVLWSKVLESDARSRVCERLGAGGGEGPPTRGERALTTVQCLIQDR